MVFATTPIAGGDVFSSPAVADGIVYVSAEDFGLHAFDAATGEALWSVPAYISAVWSSPAVANGLVYFGTIAGAMFALDAEPQVGLRWAGEVDQRGPGASVSSPAVANGTV